MVLGTEETDGVTWYRVMYEGKTGYIMGKYFRRMTLSEMESFQSSQDDAKGNEDNPASSVDSSASFANEVPSPVPARTAIKVPQRGESTVFGHYEQDNDLTNGSEPVEWIVLDVTDGKALLLSKYVLDVRPFHSKNTTATWAECTLRQWLNSDFLENAFTEEEQGVILRTEVDNSKSQGFREYDTYSGSDTEDKVFLLSVHECKDQYFNKSYLGNAWIAEGTPYAIAQGVTKNRSGYLFWWLRSPGAYGNAAATLSKGGYGYGTVDEAVGGIRPALWVRVESDED